MISNTQRKRIMLHIAAFMIIMLYNYLNTFIPGSSHDIISFSYMGFVVVWYLSIKERVINDSMRRFFFIGALSLVLLFILRLARWNYFGMYEMPNELLRYMNYIPLILIPMVSLNSALMVGVYNREKTRRLIAMLWIVGIGLCALVVTNTFHNFAFRIKDSNPDSFSYSYGPGYYIIVFFSLTSIISAFIILIHRCRLSTSRRLAFIPILTLVVGIALIAVYFVSGGAPKLFGSKLYNLQEVYIFLYIAFWESCIQIGLIPTNSDYGKVFEASGLDAYICDINDKTVYSTKNYTPHEGSDDYRVTEQDIRGGKVVWQDDISSVKEIRASLIEVTKELADENELLELEHEMSSRKEELESLRNLYDELYDSVNPEIRSLRKLLTDIRQNGSDELPLIRQAAVLGAFIKRRSNLSILAHNSNEIDMKELEYSLRESMYYLSLANVKCSVMMGGRGSVPAEVLIRMYEIFHAVSSELIGKKCNIMVNVSGPEKLSMKIMIDSLVGEDFTERLKDRFKEGLEVSYDKDEGITYIICR